MEIKDLVEEVIAKKNKTITDEVFLLIQNDRDFMQKYLQLVHEKSLKTVNQQIGKMVMKRYGLTPNRGRNDEPESTLISSHQEFE
jgi:tRNA(Arg) A34 adenosine deaminase TadA